jgi:16S rRNA (cytidine1402-2'-O)-methyltransferase
VTERGTTTVGSLYIVSTPIGNLGDFSFRAVETLSVVSLILAEDTRHTRHLLERYEIKTAVASYHEHNEAKTTPRLVERLVGGESMALVSDAGTPLLSDPGSTLVGAAINAGIPIIPVPGASAVLSALVASGLSAERFTFFGFLTRSGKHRGDTLDEISRTRHTAVLYEAPNRLADTLGELEGLGNSDRAAVVARELTKRFEEIRRGTVSELRAYYEGTPPRGEIVLVLGDIAAVRASDEQIAARVRELRRSGMSVRDTASLVATELGVAKRVAYRMAQELVAGEDGE